MSPEGALEAKEEPPKQEIPQPPPKAEWIDCQRMNLSMFLSYFSIGLIEKNQLNPSHSMLKLP